jgi:predicted transcriptional regulator
MAITEQETENLLAEMEQEGLVRYVGDGNWQLTKKGRNYTLPEDIDWTESQIRAWEDRVIHDVG